MLSERVPVLRDSVSSPRKGCHRTCSRQRPSPCGSGSRQRHALPPKLESLGFSHQRHLVKCPDAGASNSATATRNPPSYAHGLHTSRLHLHRGRTRPVHRLHKRPRGNALFDERLNGLLLHIRKHVDHHLTAPLHHAKDRWFLFRQCAASTFALESVSTSFAPRVLHTSGCPLWPATP